MLIETYFSIGKVIGLIVGVLIFIAAYIYYISAYGTRFGLGLGSSRVTCTINDSVHCHIPQHVSVIFFLDKIILEN